MELYQFFVCQQSHLPAFRKEVPRFCIQCFKNGDKTNNDDFLSALSPSKMGRFLFVISHVTLNYLASTETSVGKIQKHKQKNEKNLSPPLRIFRLTVYNIGVKSTRDLMTDDDHTYMATGTVEEMVHKPCRYLSGDKYTKDPL